MNNFLFCFGLAPFMNLHDIFDVEENGHNCCNNFVVAVVGLLDYSDLE